MLTLLATFVEADSESSVPHLTDREVEVITAIARGRGNKQIARHLAISEKTGRNHISSIYKKLHVYDRLGDVLYAIPEGLVEVDGLEGE